ncbi:hypothetical protein EDB92DRAFT_1371441 [Lactarius akahatsu]|uniref:Uncharacterized protein n=1 Tax=Lactarius akahatsu TaxID=416441 RepID=A0AAD4QAS1_9AGAM|nr:hypothetical protein EDB92DRAFT_1371441 [Lactarius akahatsu]
MMMLLGRYCMIQLEGYTSLVIEAWQLFAHFGNRIPVSVQGPLQTQTLFSSWMRLHLVEMFLSCLFIASAAVCVLCVIGWLFPLLEVSSSPPRGLHLSSRPPYSDAFCSQSEHQESIQELMRVCLLLDKSHRNPSLVASSLSPGPNNETTCPPYSHCVHACRANKAVPHNWKTVQWLPVQDASA